MGPICLFDKSFLQSLSTDEAVWFDNFFYPVISPIFFIETLADLWKKPRDGKTAEEEVGIIAAKTPQLHGGPCYFHLELCAQDLMGNHVPLNGQIPMAGMRRVYREGREGAIAEVSEEAKAFQRWQDGKFHDVERIHARRWRSQVESIDLEIIERSMKSFGVNAKTCKTLEDAVGFSDEAIDGLTKTPSRLDVALEVLDIPKEYRQYIKERWKKCGRPPLRIFAPYAAHVLRVELFFRISLGANLIASTRPSHKIDMAYLFYLPFCTIFASSDKLHQKCSPLFLRSDQEFVWGQELKADLASLNAYFCALPDETKRQGIFKFAKRLPEESNGAIRKIFERHCPHLLKSAASFDPDKIEKGAHEKLLQEMKSWEGAPSGDRPPRGDIETLIVKRSVSRVRGSWVQIGPEIAGPSESVDE